MYGGFLARIPSATDYPLRKNILNLEISPEPEEIEGKCKLEKYSIFSHLSNELSYKSFR